jgi:hypothetical protein
VPLYVSVIGPGDGATAADLERAGLAGRLLADAGAVVVTGGYGGVMGAAAEGAAGAGGLTVGILSGVDRAAAHPANAVTIPTGLGELRNGLVVRSGDAVLALGGSWGTLSEVAMAVRTGVPIVAVDGWDLPAPGPHPAATVEEAVEWVLARAAERSGSS